MARPTPEETLQFSCRRAGLAVRLLATALACLLCLLAVWGVSSRSTLAISGVVPEQYPRLELVQVCVWLAIGAVAAVACATNPTYRGILIAFWLCVLSTLAVFRELDLHTLLNPQNIHLLGIAPEHGVRFRLDWWTDAQTSVLLRILWAGAFVALAALIILPFAVARYPWFGQFFRRAPFALLFGIGIAFMGLGYIVDDVFSRPLSRAGISVSIIEELSEVAGPLLILVAVALLASGRARLFPASSPTRGPTPSST